MKRISFILGLFVLGAYSFANLNAYRQTADENKTSFEGVISFTKKTGTSENKYKYYVKGNIVRIEELNVDENVQGIMLVNTSDKSIKALSPERKLYMDVPNRSTYSTSSVTMEKKESTKSLMNYTCTEWVASSSSENRKISYWMAFDNFDFFIPFLKTLNRKDKQAVYFLAMTGTQGAFPMLSVETKSDGTEVSRLEVTKIEKKTLDNELFQIPEGFSKM